MAERKTVTTISVITDSETSYDNIGDIDGGMFDRQWLNEHVRTYGPEGLFAKLAWMNFQICSAVREMSFEADQYPVGAKEPVGTSE